MLETLGAIVYIRLKRQLNINSHLILGTVLFLIINEGSLIIAESNVINTSYLVLVLIIDLCIVNVFGNIELGRNQRKISVIIPAHNSANTIVEALESIKNQTYRDWEIILNVFYRAASTLYGEKMRWNICWYSSNVSTLKRW